MTDNGQANFEKVLASELLLIARTRSKGSGEAEKNSNQDKKASVYTRACDSYLTGLAFSGGGIRSATFNLGIIQALAKLGWLSKFDYLSTVSGGGYIGGWLSSLLHRQAKGQEVNEKFVEDISRYLKPHPRMTAAHTFHPTVGFPPVEHKAVRYLRRYSNYLSPRLGLSGDLLSVISLFLRNFILIQLVLISLVTGILLLAHGLGITSRYAGVDFSHGMIPCFGRIWPFAAAMMALGVGVWFGGRLMASQKMTHDNPLATSRAVHSGLILPILLSAWWFSAAVAAHLGITTKEDPWLSRIWVWVVGVGAVYSLAWGIGLMAGKSGGKKIRSEQKPSVPIREKLKVLIQVVKAHINLATVAILMGGLLGLILYGVVHKMDELFPTSLGLWHMIAYGPPVFILILSLVVTLHIGGAGSGFDEHDREWLARLGGFLLLYAGAWGLLFSLLLYATPLVHWLAGGGLAAMVAWAFTSGAGAWLARSASTGGEQSHNPWKEVCAKLVPWFFIAGLVVILTYTTQKLVFKYLINIDINIHKSVVFTVDAGLTLNHLNQLPLIPMIAVILAAIGFFMVIANRLDINLFSMHTLYRNRLARAYLGATRAGKRQPSPFTGFDEKDDVPFSDLSTSGPFPSSIPPSI